MPYKKEKGILTMLIHARNIPPHKLDICIDFTTLLIPSAKTFFVWTEALRQSRQTHPNVHAYYVLYLGLSIASAPIFN
jgi:hypothetical protein